jgi:hypothetical protein
MMKKVKSLLLLAACISIIMMWISNPEESIYLNRVSLEYSKHHHNAEISYEMLKQVGKSKRKNYLLFSTYAYKLGNMKFNYIGVANNVFFFGYSFERTEKPLKVV